MKRWAHRSGHGAVLRHDSAPWLDMPFFCCTKERSYMFSVSVIVANCVNVSLKKSPALSLDFVVFDTSFKRLQIYSCFDY